MLDRQEVVASLQAEFGDKIVVNNAIREQHSKGEGIALAGTPDAVAFPTSNEDVAGILRICNAAGMPVVPFGAGTSLEGHVSAIHGGVSLDMSQMDAILSVSEKSLDCRVQAGIRRKRLNTELRHTGLFFPIDPGADATIGGMAGTRASGTAAVKYGTMRENILGLTVVTPDGQIVTVGGRARKSAAGLDLTSLFIGSEGILGVITEIQLRLHPLPETTSAAVCQFPSTAAAVDSVIDGLHAGVDFARVELLNDAQMRDCIAYSKLDEFTALPTLFLEFTGTEAQVAEQTDTMQAICADQGGTTFRFASLAEDRTRLWTARHNAYYACVALRPGKKNITTDACVPISELAQCLRETEADIASLRLDAPIVGHVGDGNFHLVIMYDPTDAGETERAEALARGVGERAIRLGGTCTGEHGIGEHKRGLLELERGGSMELMRSIKQALDPKGIMNPGKMLLGANAG